MAVSEAQFGGSVILFFYPLIFLGDIIILNMTTAVVIVCFNSRAHSNFKDKRGKHLVVIES